MFLKGFKSSSKKKNNGSDEDRPPVRNITKENDQADGDDNVKVQRQTGFH